MYYQFHSFIIYQEFENWRICYRLPFRPFEAISSEQVIQLHERLLAAIAILQPIKLVQFAKVAQRVDAVCLADVRGADTQVAILDALCLNVSLGVGFVDADEVAGIRCHFG